MRKSGISSALKAVDRTIADELHTGIAVATEERLEAARLVGRLYRAEGYLPDGAPDAPFITPHHLLPEATVFAARLSKRVAGTLTVVCDSASGLPLEDLYGAEVARLRGQHRVPCELCSLAVDPDLAERSPQVVLSLFRCATAYLLHFTSSTDALITLKPAHAAFYGKRLCFRDFGGFKQDARFADAATVAMRLSREDAQQAAVSRRLAPVFGQMEREELATMQAALRGSRLQRLAPLAGT